MLDQWSNVISHKIVTQLNTQWVCSQRKNKDSQLGQRSRGYMERDEGREGADKEEQGALIDLLTCPCSPWQHTGSWSPQAAALRKLAVRNPERLDEKYISSYFTTLRIVGKRVRIHTFFFPPFHQQLEEKNNKKMKIM